MIASALDTCKKTEQLKKWKTVHGGHLGEKRPLNIAIPVTDAKKKTGVQERNLELRLIFKNQNTLGKLFKWIGSQNSLPPGGDRNYNDCLLIVDQYSKTTIFLPRHNDETSVDTAILLWNRVICHTGLYRYIISGRDPRFTYVLWTNLHRLFGTKLSYSTAYHPQNDGLAERIIQTLEDLIRRFCAYGLEFKYSDGCTHH
ncbi:hypothetical protein O181_098160 [Austropuccinia psidii MF-1]|uniref:Integrase catalytic domain-containing protein n=1 Tax=Austropuccinia psidii MF-1 TaxID=1389203 RepID=A0A9Q3JB16_9BASI|nr:hypothetical protein [Austropuccinia psidii MF-1]